MYTHVEPIVMKGTEVPNPRRSQWRSEGGAWPGMCPAKAPCKFVPLMSRELTRSAHERLAYSRCPANAYDLATLLGAAVHVIVLVY